MRDVKFDSTKDRWDNDDIAYAFEYNSLAHRLVDIDVIVAEVCGANDEDPWYWILQMKDGTFSQASGWCDYTGWDCQSGAYIKDGFKTPQEAIESVEIKYDKRKVKEVLHAQIDGRIPFAVYQDDIPTL